MLNHRQDTIKDRRPNFRDYQEEREGGGRERR